MAETEINLSKRILEMCDKSVTVALIAVGHEIGFYRELAIHGPLTIVELAKATSAVEIYVREWLTNQVSAGFISSEPPLAIETEISAGRHPLELPNTHKFFLSDVQKRVLFDEKSKFFSVDHSYLCSSISHTCISMMPTEVLTGQGTESSKLHRYFTLGLELQGRTMGFKFPNAIAQALGTNYFKEVEERKNGYPIIVLDLGCGSAYQLRAVAKEYPHTLCVGIDSNPLAIQMAKEFTLKDGLESRCLFHLASSLEFPGPSQVPEIDKAWATLLGSQVAYPVPDKYDIVLMVNALHEMRDPLLVLRNVREKLTQGGVVLLIEAVRKPRWSWQTNNERISFLAGASFSVCLPNANGGSEVPMGGLASDRHFFDLAKEAGYSEARIAFERIYVLNN